MHARSKWLRICIKFTFYTKFDSLLLLFSSFLYSFFLLAVLPDPANTTNIYVYIKKTKTFYFVSFLSLIQINQIAYTCVSVW